MNLKARIRNSSLLTSSREVAIDKTYDNRMYGMIDVLADYAELSKTRDYLVRIQHGLVDPSILIKDYTPRLNSKLAQLIWTEAPNSRGIPHVYSIGAPFIYLKPTNRIIKPEKDLVVVPHGGTYNTSGPSGFSKQIRHFNVHKNLRKYAEKPAVLLYWHDFLDPEIRSSYTDQGYEVQCAGFPGLPSRKLSKNEIAGQVQFLNATQEILLRSRRLIIFEPTTVALYAAFLGIEIKYEPESYLAQLEREIEVLPSHIRNKHNQNCTYQSSVMVSLLQSNSFEIARTHLGYENKKNPKEVASILRRFEGN